MPETDEGNEAGNFRPDQPPRNEGFFLKGCGALDWGMQSRLSRIFHPTSGRTVIPTRNSQRGSLIRTSV